MGVEKNKALNKTVHNRDILRIDELVREYLSGDKKARYQAQKEILEYFDSYIEKYTMMFMGGKVDLINYDTRGFLAMFLTGRAKTYVNFAAQRAYISKVMSRFTKDDIKNELITIFLTILSKYRIYPGVNALNPLTKLFKFRVKDWFNKIVKDALFKSYEPSGSGVPIGADKQAYLESWLDSLAVVQPDYEDGLGQMDLQWVASPKQHIYKSLSPYERYLLFLTFNQDLSIVQIAEKLERDKDTIKRHLSTVYEKMEGFRLNEVRGT